MIQIRKIAAEETYPIRLEILRKNISLPLVFDGDLDTDTFHLGVFKGDVLIAVSSFMKVRNKNFKGTQYQLRGMATLKEYRGLGAGNLMMEKAFSILNDLQIDCLWCNARIIAVKFYQKLGLKTFGDLFEIKPVGNHYVMFKNLRDA